MPTNTEWGSQKPVIFLAFANYHANFLHNLDQEHRKILLALDEVKTKGLCEVDSRPGVTIKDIFDVFQKYRDRIAIFHFAGHANDYTLLLESEEGGNASAHSAGLVSFLAKQKGLQLVFINGCSSKHQAQELIKAGVPAVVGTTQPIDDAAAIDLAERFYKGLARGVTIDEAWAAAVSQVTSQIRAFNFRALRWQGKEETRLNFFPWDIYYRDGAEKVKEWNLPDAADSPLFGLLEIPEVAALRHAYLSQLFEEARRLSLAGIDPKAASSEQESRLQLEAVYTALLTQASAAWEADEKAMRSEREQRRLSALEQLNQHQRLVLLGDPGSGKSTFVNFVALCLAGEGLGKTEANVKILTQPLPSDTEDDKKRPQPWAHGALLPVRVILRDFAAHGLPASGQNATAEHLWKFIATELGRHNLTDYAQPLRAELLRHGGLLLLDGLDGVPEAQERRQQLKQAVEDFVACYSKCRVLITSRTCVYQKQDWRLASFAETALAPFTVVQIQYFIEHWYAHVATMRGMNATNAQGRATILKRSISGSRRLQGLAEHPLLLTLMASLHAWRGSTLPEKQEELYSNTVDLLLDWWESPKVVRDPAGQVRVEQPSLAEYLMIDRQKVRGLLNEFAFHAHAAQPDLTGTADIAKNDLLNGLLRLSTNPDVRPQRLIEYLSRRAGLLLPRGVQVYTFPHRTFQEYLAACYLTDHDYPDKIAQLARQEPNRWREVAMLAGAKAARGSASTIWLLVDALCEQDFSPNKSLPADIWGAHLAGQALAETADFKQLNSRNQQKLARVQDWLAYILRNNEFPAIERASAGDSLARLGDPRQAVTTLDHLEFCWVPAGDFWMGGEEYNDKTPEHLNKHLAKDYWISRFPITVAQYQIFVNTTNHKPVHPLCLEDPANRPVRFVTWHEALKYCEWLTQHWRTQGLLPENWRVNLPSEAEWEKAARGGVKIPEQALIRSIREFHSAPLPALVNNDHLKRRFPWGDDEDAYRANSEYTKIGTTNAVGCFAGGKSRYGCEEMSGNVWEWTRSLWGKHLMEPEFEYPYDPNDGRESLDAPSEIFRVVRGGAFNLNPRYVRCAFRLRNYPNYWRVNVGFRVVLSP